MFSEKATKIWRNHQTLSEILEISSYYKNTLIIDYSCGVLRIVYEFKKFFNFYLPSQTNSNAHSVAHEQT